MATHRENIGLIDTAATNYIDQYRDPNRSYPGHEKPHLRTVARLTELVALIADYSPQAAEDSRIAGWFHDFEKSPNETNRISDERLSADAATRFLELLNTARIYRTTANDRAAVSHAILNAGHAPRFFTERPDSRQWTLPEQVLAALFVADKIEANGVWVIARGSQVIAGSMLHDKDADLPNYGLQPNRDEIKAVLLERAVRISFINPESIYPPVFRLLTSQMYGPQRDFIHGLLASEGMGIEDYAKLLLETNYLQRRKLPVLNRTELAQRLHLVGGLSDEGIREAAGDLACSAAEAVAYFSGHYNQQPLEVLVEGWQPQYNQAKLWQHDMVDYMNGSWFNRIRSQILNQTI